jgi:Holliday junction DNA helicase RuvB
LAQVRRVPLSKTIVEECLSFLGIDELGLTSADRNILEILMDKFGGGPVGLSTLSAATNEEETTIEDVIEPYLIQLGFLERTPKGRLATRAAYAHMGRNFPKNRQDALL